jgi:hypothetical protein
MIPSLRPLFKPTRLILLLSVLQILCATYFLDYKGFQGINSLLFLASGLLISWLMLKVPAVPVSRRLLFRRSSVTRLLALLPLLPISYYLCRKIMDGTPIGIESADMLPIMKVMVSRFLDGGWSTVYAPIPEIWGGIQPIYLPAMWMPYIYSTVLNFDMRWITFLGIWSCVALFVWPGRWKAAFTYVLPALGILTLLCWFHFERTNNVIRLSEEGVVFFYYSLLAVALISGKPYLVGIASALCLLSRYALIGWIPFGLIYLLYRKEYTFLLRTLAAGLLTGGLLLFPFGMKPLLVHLSQPTLYIQHAERIWRESPEYFYRSLGMAKFFGPSGVRPLHYVLLFGTFLVPLAFFFLIRKRAVAPNLALLSCLQLSLTIFYNFIDVSYLYLFYTPVFFSLVSAGWLHAFAGDAGLAFRPAKAAHSVAPAPEKAGKLF